MRRLIDIMLPLAVAALVLGFWQWAVMVWQAPVYVLPAPSAIAAAFVSNFSSLIAALTATFLITIAGFSGAVAAALALAILFSQSRLIERSLYPYAVILQVTPVVAIAPLILIWIAGRRLRVSTPVCLITSGSFGSPSATRFCTRICARFRSTPCSKVIVRLYAPSLVHELDM